MLPPLQSQNQVDYGPLQVRTIARTIADSAAVPIPQVCLGLFSDKEHSALASATSDGDGRFRFKNVAGGRYR